MSIVDKKQSIADHKLPNGIVSSSEQKQKQPNPKKVAQKSQNAGTHRFRTKY